MPFYTDAYLADTQDLSTEEHGAYVLLLMAAWRTPSCALPDDDERLARMVKVGTKKWRKLRPILLRFFHIEDGMWVQKRLSKEREKAAAQSRSASEKASKRWHGRDDGNRAANATSVAANGLENRDNADAAAYYRHMPDKNPSGDRREEQNSFLCDADGLNTLPPHEGQAESDKSLKNQDMDDAEASSEHVHGQCTPYPYPYKTPSSRGNNPPARDPAAPSPAAAAGEAERSPEPDPPPASPPPPAEPPPAAAGPDLGELYRAVQTEIGSPMPLRLAPIQRWVADGCDPWADVWPAVQEIMAGVRERSAPLPSSINYFKRRSFEMRDERLAGRRHRPTAPKAEPGPAEQARRARYERALRRYIDQGARPDLYPGHRDAFEGGPTADAPGAESHAGPALTVIEGTGGGRP